MSVEISSASPIRSVPARWLARLYQKARRVTGAMPSASQRKQTRLHEINDHLRRDVGLPVSEASRPYWTIV